MRYFSLKKVLLITILLLSFCISIGYAALNTSLAVSGDLVYRVPADIRISGVKISSVSNGGLEQYTPKYTKDTVSLGLKLPNLNSTVIYEVTVRNTSSKKKMISSITNKVAGNTNISYTYDYVLNTVIAANSTIKILFTFKYNSGITSIPSNQVKENTISLTYTDATFLYDEIKKEAVLDNVSSKYVTSSTGINFKNMASDTNGKGLYIMSSTKNNNYPIHYYRGDITNNNVVFGGFCWKIVRTTATGGIKLIYNGMADSSKKCINITSTSVGETNFSSETAYSYSIIYKKINSWYEENMMTYTSKLEDTEWCFDTSIYKQGTENGQETKHYGPYGRVYELMEPSLTCPKSNDIFTVSNSKLKYPVALINADEALLAGILSQNLSGNNTFLCNESSWWLMSPSYSNGVDYMGSKREYIYGFALSGCRIDKSANLWSDYDEIRPSVSLANGTIISGGTGTTSDPYKVSG